ncbi:MAG: S1/P1 nuclease [Gammaproteobacteria bacterium]|nr:S1/P1 nuclease [Gammaproteobacteria bacterium]
MSSAIRPTLASTMALAVGLLLAAYSAFAWGPQGHRTIGAIADRLLTPAAHAAVLEILADDRDKFDNPSLRSTLESVSDWADEVRGTAADRPAWHYDDAPVCGAGDKARYCPDGQCNSAQLKRLITVLSDAHAAARERDEALKWIVHLLGDIHQPLHAADNGDQGGNLVRVALEGVHTRGRASLHKVWDNDLVQLALHARNRQRPPPDIDALAAEAANLGREVGQGTPESWARESNNLARNVAYRYPGFACNRVPPGIVVLDVAYLDDAELVVRERLLLAGARLATLLNSILANVQQGGPRRLR